LLSIAEKPLPVRRRRAMKRKEKDLEFNFISKPQDFIPAVHGSVSRGFGITARIGDIKIIHPEIDGFAQGVHPPERPGGLF
jgi:hypothetical protein